MLQKIAVFFLSLLVLVVVAFGYVLWFANTDRGRAFISAKATKALEREVTYAGNLQLLRIMPLTLRITDLEVANIENGRADKMVDLGMAEVSVRLLPLLAGKVDLPYVFLDDSAVNLERTAERRNWDFGDKDEPKETDQKSNLTLGKLNLRDSTLSYYDVPQNIDLKVDARTEGEHIIVHGEGTYLGEGFVLDITGGELLSARTDNPYPVDAKVTVGYTTIEAKGVIEDPMNFGGLNVAFHLKGADAAELFPLFGIALPPTPPYDLRGQLTYNNAVWSFANFSGVMGKSDISGDVEWNQSGERPKLTAQFLSQKLDLVDLGPLIGLTPREQVSDEQRQYASKREESPFLIPDVPLDITRVRAMDADVTYKGNEVVSPFLPLDDFMLRVILDNSLLTIDPLRFGTADGDVTAHFVVNAREEPVAIDADFTFARLSLARLTESVNKSLPMTEKAEGMIGGTAKLSGTGASLKDMLSNASGNVGVGMEGGQISNLLIELVGLDIAEGLGFLIAGDKVVPVRCIIGDFGVEDGMMQSRALVIDTEDTNIQGEGSINLKTEEMRLRIVPQPKDATLATLRVPLRVEGTMKSPNIIIEKGALLAKGAGAVALGAIFTPIASWLAFVETGLGKDSNCTALVSTMNANTGTNDVSNNVPANPNAPSEQPNTTPVEATPTPAANDNVKPPMQERIVEHPGAATPVLR